MFKRVICLILCMSFIFCGCMKKEKPLNDLQTVMKRGKLIVGVKTDSKPFGYKDINNNLTGYDVELARIIAKYLLDDENKVEFVSVTSQSRIGTLYAGDVDMIIATMSITKGRMQVVDFSVPYHYAGQAVLVPRGSDITSLNELDKKKIIVVYGSTSEKNIRMRAPEAQLIGYKTYPEAFAALKAGKADAMTSDDTILLKYAIDDPSVRILPKRYSKEPYAVAYRKGEESTALREKVDNLLIDMRKSGKLKKLCDKWGVDG